MQKSRNESKAQIFILPFAGGSVYNYSDWQNRIIDDIEICFLELAGRGSRMGEPFYKCISEAVEDIYRLFKQEYKGGEYYIFGHSMGSLLAFELYYRIVAGGGELPEHIFLSGRNPPDLCHNIKKVGHYADMDFLNEVAKYGAVPQQLFEDEEVREIFLPILRADFSLLEEYKCKKPMELIDCNITIFWGNVDFSTDRNFIYRWREYGKRDVTIVGFLGDHFFLMDEQKKEMILHRIERIYKQKKRRKI